MSSIAPAAIAPVAPPPPLPVRASRDPSGTFASIAAIGAAFAGFVHHQYDPDPLSTAFAVGITFFGAFLALLVLHVVFRLTMAVARVVVPVGLVLLIGCAFDWPWAEVAVDWLRAAGSYGLAGAERIWSVLPIR